jgi:hypothetical protein
MFGKNPKIDAVASSVLQVIEKVTTDTTKGREAGSINSFTPAKVTLKGDVEKKPDPKEPQETAARKSIEAKTVKTEETVQEVSPPGWSGTVKAMKKHKNISNPFALAWSMKKKGAKSHIKAEEVEQVEEGLGDTLKKAAKKAVEVLGGPDDEGHKKDLQRKMGIPQTGKPGHAKQNEEVEQVEEGWDEMLKSVKDKQGPQPNGGSGKKQGSAYGGSKQKDKPEQEVKEACECSDEDEAQDKKEAKKRHMSMKEWEKSAADKKQDMKEAKTLSPGQDDAPFEPPYKEKKETVTDKSGAKHTPMSRARNLARAAMDKIKKDHKLG